MKILYHHRTLAKDGQNVHITEMIAAFRRAGHEVLVVGPAGYAEATFGSDGGFLSRLRAALPRAIGEVFEVGYSVVAFVRLWRAWRRFRPDFLYERYNLFLLAGVWLRMFCRIPFVLEVNSPLRLERGREPGLGLPRLAQWCEESAWRAADLILPVTEVLAGHLKAAKAERILVLPNGIAPDQFPASLDGSSVRAKYGLRDKIVIGFTGFLRRWHGLPALVEALGGMGADVHLLIVGDGPARAELEEAARRHGVEDRLTITGVVDRHELPELIAAFDIAVQPQATDYASPLKLFEYMALGCAIVAPDQPNIREVLEDGRNALLFTSSDPLGFKQAIHRLAADTRLRETLGAGAMATVIERNLTWDGNAARVVASVAGSGRSFSKPAS